MLNIITWFFIKCIFTINMLIIILMYIKPLEKRKNFPIHLLLGMLICFVVSTTLELSFIKYIIELLTVILFCYITCSIKITDAIYCTACAYATQHFSYALYRFVYRPEGWVPLYSVPYALCCFITYVVFYFVFAKRLPENGNYHINIRYTLVSMCVTLSFALGLSYVAQYYFNRDNSPLYYICEAYAMLCCAFMLWQQVEHQGRLRLQREYDFQQQLWHKQQEQYALAKDNVDVITRICHDLKHQINALKTFSTDEQRDSYYREIEDSILAYDLDIKTGSEVLDVVLAEKKLKCMKSQINMTCVADGVQLGFMDAVDVYTIFGNALDNAIESVIQIEDPTKRVISVSVWTKSNLLLLQFENYYEQPLVFSEGIPLTTKPDEMYHGFGIKGINYTVQKYGGCIGIYPEDNIFILRISIPIS